MTPDQSLLIALMDAQLIRANQEKLILELQERIKVLEEVNSETPNKEE